MMVKSNLFTLPFYLAATEMKSCSCGREPCVNGCGDLRGSILWIECVHSVCFSLFRSATGIRRHGTHRAKLPLTAFGWVGLNSPAHPLHPTTDLLAHKGCEA
jgi:hypothetical protein